MQFLAVDPGTTESAYVVMHEDYSTSAHAKVPNQQLLNLINEGEFQELVIECMESRAPTDKRGNQSVIGWTTYETCYWIGRFMEAASRRGMPVYRVMRTEEKSRIIPTKKNRLPPLPPPVPDSTDGKIRHGLIARFAKFDKKNGKGRAGCRDTFYGFKADEWSAFAVGVVHLDKLREEALKRRLKA